MELSGPGERPKTSSWSTLLLAAATLGLCGLFWSLYQYCVSLGTEKWDALAAIGQHVGAWATSVSFVALILSLYGQQRQLALQQHALQSQFEELRNQRSALQQTAPAVAAQLFLQSLGSAERTLARDMRTIMQLCGVPPSDLDRLGQQAAEADDYSKYAESFCLNGAVRDQRINIPSYSPNQRTERHVRGSLSFNPSQMMEMRPDAMFPESTLRCYQLTRTHFSYHDITFGIIGAIHFSPWDTARRLGHSILDVSWYSASWQPVNQVPDVVNADLLMGFCITKQLRCDTCL